MEDYRTRLERKLQVGAGQRTLLRAAALLIGWELIRTEIIDKVRDFFITGFDQKGFRYAKAYESRVLVRSPHIFDASVDWLLESGGLTTTQAASLRELRDYRNAVAHELGTYLVDPDREIDVSKLFAMREVVTSLGRFWGQITVDTDPDFDGRDIAPEDIVSGPMMLFDYALSLLPADDA